MQMYKLIRYFKGGLEVVDYFSTMAEAIKAIPGYKEAYGASSQFDIVRAA